MGTNTKPKTFKHLAPALRTKRIRQRMTCTQNSTQIRNSNINSKLINIINYNKQGSAVYYVNLRGAREGAHAGFSGPTVLDKLGNPKITAPDETLKILELGRRAIPPKPDHRLIPVVEVPAPASLPKGLADEDCVRALVWCYRGVHEVRSGQPMLTRSMRDPATTVSAKTYDTLLRFGRAIDFSPSAWARFSFDVFPTDSYPRMTWVYSLKRLDTQGTWWGEVRNQYCAGAVRIAPAHEFLYRDYRLMWQELRRSNPTRREQVLEIIENFFPGDSWEKRVHAARVQSHQMQRILEVRAARGYCIWEEKSC